MLLHATLLAMVLAGATARQVDTNWEIFKSQYGKQYGSPQEEAERYAIYLEKVDMINAHNEKYANGQSSYYMAVNKFADLTAQEYKAFASGRNSSVALPTSVGSVQLSDDLPSYIDWRDYGYVTEVQYQGECGSCWSFATAGAIEGQHKRATDALINLSESQLVDCSSSYGNNGCNGGNEVRAYQYVIDVGGIESDSAYPYVPEQQACKFDYSKVAAKISSYVRVQSGSEDALKQAVGTVGPVSIGMDATHESFGYYSGGIYDEPACSSTELTHAMLAVGYSWTWIWGEEYWIVKNSWGTDWGDDGYIYMSMNNGNQCGIATDASYPVV